MENILKIGMTGVVVSILVMLLRDMQSKVAPLLAILGSLVILAFVVKSAKNTTDAIKVLFDDSGIGNETVKEVIKIIGISYVAEFSSSVCKDIGENSIATKIETAGRIIILMMSIPWAAALLEAVKTLM